MTERAISTGDRRTLTRAHYLVSEALAHARVRLSPEQRVALFRELNRLAIEEGYILTKQTSG